MILNEHGATYAQDLQELARDGRADEPVDRSATTAHPGHGAVHILRGDQLSDDDRTLLLAAARAVLLSRRGSLADQVIRLERPERIARTARTARAAPTTREREP